MTMAIGSVAPLYSLEAVVDPQPDLVGCILDFFWDVMNWAPILKRVIEFI